ncbi:MAG TPA: hypothetical protein VLT92_15190, partial [Burkholderiales bacterium]|nr:hypothetical protein [Burkholderiales bacterium]
LSMEVDVDTHERRGERLPHLAQKAPDYATNVFRSVDELAGARAKSIIAANDGGRPVHDQDRHLRAQAAQLVGAGHTKLPAVPGNNL